MLRIIGIVITVVVIAGSIILNLPEKDDEKK